MNFRDLLARIRDTRSGATTDPLGLDIPAENMPADIPAEPEPPADPWLDQLTPDVGEETDPGGADLASVDPAHQPPAGAIVTAQTKYPGGRRCTVVGCGAPCVADVCVPCTAAGRLPVGMDGWVPPGMERVLPDPPLHLPPRSTFATEDPFPSAANPDGPWAIRYPPDDRELTAEDQAVLERDLRRAWAYPPPRLDGAGYVLEPLADFEEARDRIRGEILERIHPSIAPAETAPTVAYLNRMLSVDGGDAA